MGSVWTQAVVQSPGMGGGAALPSFFGGYTDCGNHGYDSSYTCGGGGAGYGGGGAGYINVSPDVGPGGGGGGSYAVAGTCALDVGLPRAVTTLRG